MAFLSTKCPNCGSNMELHNNQLSCPYCRTTLLQIADSKIDADVSIISASDFAKKIKESKRTFVINVNNNLETLDVETKIINKRIDDATEMLRNGKFDEVISHLSTIYKDILAVERLRYLAYYKAKSEYELSFHNGRINGNNFRKLLSLCDPQSKETYERIEKFCSDNYYQRNAIKSELSQIDKLIRVELYDEAITISTEMCKKYPNSALSWAYLIKSKYYCYGDVKKPYKYFSKVKREFKILACCPDSHIIDDILEEADFVQHYLPERLREMYRNLVGKQMSFLKVLGYCALGLFTGIGIIIVLAIGRLPQPFADSIFLGFLLGPLLVELFFLFRMAKYKLRIKFIKSCFDLKKKLNEK